MLIISLLDLLLNNISNNTATLKVLWTYGTATNTNSWSTHSKTWPIVLDSILFSVRNCNAQTWSSSSNCSERYMVAHNSIVFDKSGYSVTQRYGHYAFAIGY